MRGLLELTSDLPERLIDAGHAILREGESAGQIWVLVDGQAAVRKGELIVATVDEPGAPFGEMAALLSGTSTATVEATRPSRFRLIEEGAAWLADHPEAVVAIATALARRLELVTAYLGDLRHQYADADVGLGMIDDVLATLVTTDRPRAEPGSDRDPDPLY